MGSGALVGKRTTPLPPPTYAESICSVNIISCAESPFKALLKMKGRLI